jgi:hypothetical protein
MAIDRWQEEPVGSEETRVGQERELAACFSLVAAEHALAAEAFAIGQALALVGIAFDPTTFVALRLLEVSAGFCDDPVGCLDDLQELGLVDRTVEHIRSLLEEAA